GEHEHARGPRGVEAPAAQAALPLAAAPLQPRVGEGGIGIGEPAAVGRDAAEVAVLHAFGPPALREPAAGALQRRRARERGAREQPRREARHDQPRALASARGPRASGFLAALELAYGGLRRRRVERARL